MSHDDNAMLFSAESLELIRGIGGWVNDILKTRALELAKQDGRTLVSELDARAAFDAVFHRRTTRLLAACRAARLVLRGTTAVSLEQQAAVNGAVVMLGEVIEEEGAGVEQKWRVGGP
jgi:hypothetical protein